MIVYFIYKFYTHFSFYIILLRILIQLFIRVLITIANFQKFYFYLFERQYILNNVHFKISIS